MRKVVLHIAVVLVLLSATVGHMFASSQGMVAGVVAKHTSGKAILNNNDPAYQSDVVLDINDYDEYDFDDHDIAGEKPFFNPQYLYIATLLAADCQSNGRGNTQYTQYHISRIPRYDYITLRVLRI